MKKQTFIGLVVVLLAGGTLIPVKLVAQSTISVSAERGLASTTTKTAFLTTITVNPHLAVWLEKTDGSFIKTIYVSLKKGEQDYWVGKRPHPLPVWNALAEKRPLVDVVSGASTVPPAPAKLDWSARLPTGLDSVVVKLEVNLAFDYNKTWPESPQEVWGQPSLIYRSPLSLATGVASSRIMELVGRADGQGGNWIADLSGIDSARQILSKITATLK